MDIDCQPQQQLRRSLRLKNKFNTNGCELSGDKCYLFTHNFNDKRHAKHSKQNHNHNHSKTSIYPIISRCKRRLKFVHHAPNVFVIDNFLTQNEINHLLQIVSNNQSKFEVSYTQATSKDQIYSTERTSSFIFLQKYMDKISRTIEARASDIVSISIENVEPLQVIKYSDGQEFTLHHDAGTLINESRKKHSSSSLLSVASNHSMDFIRNAQMYQNIAKSMNINTQPNHMHNTPFPAQIQQQQEPNYPPQHLTSAQYAMYYQQWQQKVQHHTVIAQKQMKRNQQTPKRPQSCPPVFMHQAQSNMIEEEEEELTKQEFEEKYDEYSVEIVAPIRLFSFFVYLTTLPEGCGGETCFPKLGLKVRPERGKAVLWCNVDPKNTNKGDAMLIHRACPVKGNHIKIGMNIWINNTKVDSNYR